MVFAIKKLLSEMGYIRRIALRTQDSVVSSDGICTCQKGLKVRAGDSSSGDSDSKLRAKFLVP